MIQSHKGEILQIGDFISVCNYNHHYLGWYAGEGKNTIQFYEIPIWNPSYFLKKVEMHGIENMTIKEVYKGFVKNQIGREIRIDEKVITDKETIEEIEILKKI